MLIFFLSKESTSVYFKSFVCYWLPDLFCYKENNRLYNKTPQLSFMDVELCVICGRVQIWRFSICSPLNVQM